MDESKQRRRHLKWLAVEIHELGGEQRLHGVSHLRAQRRSAQLQERSQKRKLILDHGSKLPRRCPP